MPPSGRRSEASIAGSVRSLRRAAVATRLSRRTTPFARTRRASSADETFELTSGVAFATIAASRHFFGGAAGGQRLHSHLDTGVLRVPLRREPHGESRFGRIRRGPVGQRDRRRQSCRRSRGRPRTTAPLAARRSTSRSPPGPANSRRSGMLASDDAGAPTAR